jgi:hypothetical protein
MNRFFRLLAIISALALVTWGGLLVTLDAVGASATAQQVSARRFGGDRGDPHPNRYNWSIGYAFATPEGRLISGRATAIGNSMSVRPPKRIRYLPFFPYINAPEDQTGAIGMSLGLIGIGAFLLWALLRGRPGRAGAARRPGLVSRRERPREVTSNNRADVDPCRWLTRYRRDARRYAWTFFAGVVVAIAVLVRLGLDGWSMEWFQATAFAALLTAVLAFYSRRTVESTWVGRVCDKQVRERHRNADVTDRKELMYRVFFRTPEGKVRRLHVDAELFDRYREGEHYRKVAGLNYPLPIAADVGAGFCAVCGGDYADASDRCPRCGAPILRLSDLDCAQPGWKGH